MPQNSHLFIPSTSWAPILYIFICPYIYIYTWWIYNHRQYARLWEHSRNRKPNKACWGVAKRLVHARRRSRGSSHWTEARRQRELHRHLGGVSSRQSEQQGQSPEVRVTGSNWSRARSRLGALPRRQSTLQPPECKAPSRQLFTTLPLLSSMWGASGSPWARMSLCPSLFSGSVLPLSSIPAPFLPRSLGQLPQSSGIIFLLLNSNSHAWLCWPSLKPSHGLPGKVVCLLWFLTYRPDSKSLRARI